MHYAKSAIGSKNASLKTSSGKTVILFDVKEKLAWWIYMTDLLPIYDSGLREIYKCLSCDTKFENANLQIDNQYSITH